MHVTAYYNALRRMTVFRSLWYNKDTGCRFMEKMSEPAIGVDLILKKVY